MLLLWELFADKIEPLLNMDAALPNGGTQSEQSGAELSDCREQGAASRCWVLNNSGVCGIIIEYLFEKDD